MCSNTAQLSAPPRHILFSPLMLTWWNVVWFFGENTIGNRGTLITPSGSGPVSKIISSKAIKEMVKLPGDFDRSVECSKSGDEQYSLASRLALIQCRVQAQHFKFPSLKRPWHDSSALVRLANQQIRSFGFACPPKSNGKEVNIIQSTAKDVISEFLDN